MNARDVTDTSNQESSPGSSSGIDGALNHDLFAGLATIMLGSVTFFASPGWDVRAWFFPNAIATSMIVVGGVLVTSAIVKRRRETVFDSLGSAMQAGWFAGSLVIYLYLVEAIGYLYASWLFAFTVSLILSSQPRWYTTPVAFAGSGLGAGFLYYLFGTAFNVPLPDGVWL